jgi:hypothetical protein
MIADMVDLVWLLGGAISLGFLSYGGYLAIACCSVAEQDKLTAVRLGRRRSGFAASVRGGVRPLRGEPG